MRIENEICPEIKNIPIEGVERLKHIAKCNHPYCMESAKFWKPYIMRGMSIESR